MTDTWLDEAKTMEFLHGELLPDLVNLYFIFHVLAVLITATKLPVTLYQINTPRAHLSPLIIPAMLTPNHKR